MSITNALNNAASGLAASARLADTISNNVANAMTDGFGRRTTEISSLSLGGYGSGARVGATTRAESPYLTAERRGMDAALGATGTRSDTYERMMAAMGEPGAANALSTLATALETTLMSATASPQSTAKLTEAVSAAEALADAINRIAEENVRLRTEADAEIGRQVDTVNAALHAVDDINRKIAALVPKGVDVTGLQDERQRIIDGISTIIPLRTVKREHDQVALYSANGGVLLDGRVFELSFAKATNVVTPDMSVGAGLGALMQDQGAAAGPVAVPTGTGGGLFDGGSLAALFEVRDRIVPEFDAEIDRYANDLIERFRDLMPPGGARRRRRRAVRRRQPRRPDRARRADRDQRRGRPERRRRGLAAARRPRRRHAGRRGRRHDAAGADRRDDGGARPARLRLAERADRLGDDGVRDRLVLRRPRGAQRRGPRLPGGAAVGAGRAGDPRGRGRQRRRARVADAGRAGLCRQRPGAVGDRRPDEAACWRSEACA